MTRKECCRRRRTAKSASTLWMKTTSDLFMILILHADEVFKIVGLVPVRNEERRIGFCLRALAAFTDSIVVLDDSSDDRTVEVVRSLASDCRVERVITKVLDLEES